jgi:hypothetical protein
MFGNGIRQSLRQSIRTVASATSSNTIVSINLYSIRYWCLLELRQEWLYLQACEEPDPFSTKLLIT